MLSSSVKEHTRQAWSRLSGVSDPLYLAVLGLCNPPSRSLSQYLRISHSRLESRPLSSLKRVSCASRPRRKAEDNLHHRHQVVCPQLLRSRGLSGRACRPLRWIWPGLASSSNPILDRVVHRILPPDPVPIHHLDLGSAS